MFELIIDQFQYFKFILVCKCYKKKLKTKYSKTKMIMEKNYINTQMNIFLVIKAKYFLKAEKLTKTKTKMIFITIISLLHNPHK